jgi:hypothetical protein
MKVSTYYSPVSQIEEQPQRELLELWKKSWSRYGWEPVILGRDDAKESEWYQVILDNVKEFPTSNPRDYELSCFLRWAAMEAIGGGIMTDYDVMNYGFETLGIKPDDKSIFPLHCMERHVPSVVYGGRQAYRVICGLFSNYIPSSHERQVSDMTILERSAGMGVWEDVGGVLQYSEPGWEANALVHYSSHCLRGVSGRSKADKIQSLRPVE